MDVDHEQQFREQVFLFGVGMFLVGYAVSLYRYESLQWATVVASLAFVITVGAGMLLLSFIRFHPAPTQQSADAPSPATKGRAVDFTLDADDADTSAEQSTPPWQTGAAS